MASTRRRWEPLLAILSIRSFLETNPAQKIVEHRVEYYLLLNILSQPLRLVGPILP